MRRLWLWLGLVASCSSDEVVEPAATVPAIVATGPTTLPTPPPHPTLAVRLLSSGAEPRRELRYRPTVGRELQLVLDMTIDMAMTAGGHRMFGQEGKSHGKLVLRVARIDPDGKIAIDLKVIDMKDPSFDPQRPEPKRLDGLTGSFVITDRGELVSASASLESVETKAVMYLLDYLQALPAEPVGLGAEWEVDGVVLRNGITMRVVQTHKLVALDAATARTEMIEKQFSSQQRITTLIKDPLTSFDVLTFTGGGSGTSRIAFDKPLCAEAANTFGFETEMRIIRPSQTQNVKMTMRGATRVKLD